MSETRPAVAPGQDLAPDVAALLAPATPVRTAVQAAQRIHAVHDVMRALSVVAQLQLMESCWVIRRHCPDRAAFDAFLAEHQVDEKLAPDEAWAMALTHDVQRRDRRLRELVSDRPAQAMRWVRGFVDAGREERLERLDARDEQVVELLRSPPRKLRSKVRTLLEIEARQQALDLGDESAPAAGPAGAVNAPSAQWVGAARAAAPKARLLERMGELQDCVHTLDRLAEELSELLAVDGIGRAQRDRIPALTDLAFGSLERIADAAREAEERHGAS